MSPGQRVLRFPLVRLILFAIVMGVAATPLVLGLRAFHRTSSAIMEHAIVGAALLALFLVVRFVEKKPFVATFFPPASALRELGLGFAVGAGLLTAVIATLAATGTYHVDGVARGSQAVLSLLWSVWFFFVVAVFEELLFRAVIFRLVEEMVGTWGGFFVSALLFGFAHLSQPHSSPTAAIAIALEAGVLLGAVYVQRRNLWMPIGLHWAWNLFEGPIYGTSVSGTSGATLLMAHTSGSAALTGGDFGPEAGLVAVIICTAAGVYFSVRAVRLGLTMRPMWARPASA